MHDLLRRALCASVSVSLAETLTSSGTGTALRDVHHLLPRRRPRESQSNRHIRVPVRQNALAEYAPRTLVPLTSCTSLQHCRTCAPMLLLCLSIETADKDKGLLHAATIRHTFEQYAQHANGITDRRAPPSLLSTANESTAGSSSAPLLLLGTSVGAAWIANAGTTPVTPSAGADEADTLLNDLQWACQAEDFPPEAVSRLTQQLLERLGDNCTTMATVTLPTALEACLRVAAPVHVASLVRGLQCDGVTRSETCSKELSVTQQQQTLQLSAWDSRVPPALARRCLQQVADTVRGQRGAGRPQALPPSVLQSLHRCALCTLPHTLEATSTLRTELAIVAMAALRHAGFPQLRALYEYLEAAHVTVPAVLNKFLANCGLMLRDVVVGGTDATVGRRQRSVACVGPDPAAAAAIVSRAVAALADSGRDVSVIEEGLVHGSSVLVALGRHDEVKALYARFPELRVTPHLVMLHVAEENVTAAIDSLGCLARSRSDGWARFVPMVLRTITYACELVGRRGSPQAVRPLYEALVAFRNAGMNMSHLLECVLAGIAVRVRELTSVGAAAVWADGQLVKDVAPQLLLEQIVPITRATLTFFGDDANSDVIVSLLETSLESGHMAVPLTAGIVWALRQSPSLAIRDLFERVDSSTQHLPFLYYYVLCFARDRGLKDEAEGLAAVWRVDVQPLLRRASGLAPPYKLWRCAGCGRLNSDRYNYCSCSALRNGLLVCGICGYGQDERWPVCLSCGAGVGKEGAARAVVRRAWTCSGCGAANPARQTLLCFRCRAPTGPLFDKDTTCEWVESAYEGKVGYCRATGRLHHAFAAANTSVWRCAGCQQYHSTLERACPTCPQVDCLPAAVLHRVRAARFCWSCGATETNAFVGACVACGSHDLHTSTPPASHVKAMHAAAPETRTGSTSSATREKTTAEEGALEAAAPPDRRECPEQQGMHENGVWVLCCPQCEGTQTMEPAAVADSAAALTPCNHCGAALSVAENGLRNHSRKCGGCHAMLPADSVVGAMCPHCWRLVPFATEDPTVGTSLWAETPRLRQTFTTLARVCTAEALRGPAPGTTPASSSNANSVSPCETALERLCMLLTSLRAAWCGPKSARITVVPAATLSAARVPLFMELRLVLRSLEPLRPISAVSRRAAALVKQLMTAVDAECGHAAQSHFSEEEVCHECLGGHPVALCVYAPVAATAVGSSTGKTRDDTTATTVVDANTTAVPAWTCVECGVANTNEDICRYLCASCLALRPEVQERFPGECWECAQCRRANVEFETYCIHCGVQRPAVAFSSTTTAFLPLSGEEQGETTSCTATAAAAANHIPFLPCRCVLCGLIYLEATCPLCTNHLPDVAEARGVVCAVGRRHAFIQPFGTSSVADRVLVEEPLLRSSPLVVGAVVHYLAELKHGGRHVGFRATRVRD